MGEVQRKLNQIKINTFEGQFRGKYLEKLRLGGVRLTSSVIRLASYGGPGWRGRGGEAVLLFIPGTAHTHTLTRMHCTDGSESHPRHRNTHKHSSARVLVASGPVTRSFLFS